MKPTLYRTFNMATDNGKTVVVGMLITGQTLKWIAGGYIRLSWRAASEKETMPYQHAYHII